MGYESREILSEQLGIILGVDKTKIKSSDLLKAFATFTTIDNDGSAVLPKIEELRLSNANLPYRSVIITLAENVTESDTENAYNSFRSYNLETFLRFVVPDLACDVDSLNAFFKNELNFNTMRFAHEMIKIRKLMYVEKGASEKELEIETDIQYADNTVIERLYKVYSEYSHGERIH